MWAVSSSSVTSSTQTVAFPYDAAAPISTVTAPSNNMSDGRSGLATIAGTLQDQTSGGTAIGVDGSNFYVGMQRSSDNRWWSTSASSWTATATSNTISGISNGTSLLSWNLTTSSTFFDYLGAADTITVYTSAWDQVGNKESSTTSKLTYYYLVSTPTLVAGSMIPAFNAVVSSVPLVQFQINPQKGRVTQVWAAFIDTLDQYYWTGSSWSAAGNYSTAAFSPASPGVWFTTATRVYTDASEMTFSTGIANAVSGAVDGSVNPLTVTFNGVTQLSSPTWTWADGHKFHIFVKAVNTPYAWQWLDTSSNTYPQLHSFIFDKTGPVVALSSPLVSGSPANWSLSGNGSAPTWVYSGFTATGTFWDNVSDPLDSRTAYMRVTDTTTPSSPIYLNPNTLTSFNVVDPSLAWAPMSPSVLASTTSWNYDLSAANFTNGHHYVVEVYGVDGAGNLGPVTTGYFNYD